MTHRQHTWLFSSATLAVHALAKASVLAMVATLTPEVAPAQAVDRISSGDVLMVVRESTSSDSRGGFFRASRDNAALYTLNRRTEASAIELHCEWDDLLVVRSGAGVLQYGRKLRGVVPFARAEWRAREIVQPTEVFMASGDVLRVPAGEAHTIRPLGAAPLVYLVVKVRTAQDNVCGSLAALRK